MSAPSLRGATFRARRWASREAVPAVRARWHLRHAERVGPGARIRGRPLITTPDLVLGEGVVIWSHVHRTHFGGSGRLELGDRVFVNTGVIILAFDRVVIGPDVIIGPGVYISDSDNHSLEGRPTRVAPIVIGSGCWVATRAIVLPGVTIGARAVVAAGAVVTADVAADTLVAGVPARPVRALSHRNGQATAWQEDLS